MKSIIGIYDFELFPYALGDVLTWNVRTAMRCEELERETVDIYICADKRYPAGIYQRGLVNPDNFELFFSELYSAFGTHPRLGNIHIFRERESMILRLQENVAGDPVNAEALSDYLNVLGYCRTETIQNKTRRWLLGIAKNSRLIRQLFNRALPGAVKDAVMSVALPSEEAINNYFIKYIHSHESINEFAARRGRIPLLCPALGCGPDVDELIAQRLVGKKIVPFHLRLRRLDAGYGGEHSYARDSDFSEWYDFLHDAAQRYPDLVFVALGRLQEKPLGLLALPNVISLREFGMGLGHELTLMHRSDLFLGTSSGFAAYANFSAIPYFITRMNPGSCHAYAIQEGASCLPFAYPKQELIYEQETSVLLMRLLKRGLGLGDGEPTVAPAEPAEADTRMLIDVKSWLVKRATLYNPATTTCRFELGDEYRVAETAYLLMPALERIRRLCGAEKYHEASEALGRIAANFPAVGSRLPEYLVLAGLAGIKTKDAAMLDACRKALLRLGEDDLAHPGIRPLTVCIGHGMVDADATAEEALRQYVATTPLEATAP